MSWSAGGVPRFFAHIAYPDSVSFYFCGFVFSAKVWCPKKRRFRRRCHPLCFSVWPFINAHLGRCFERVQSQYVCLNFVRVCVVFESIGRFEFGVLEQQLPEDCVLFLSSTSVGIWKWSTLLQMI